MARQNIGIGTTANDGTGDDLRTGAGKINDNFIELYGFTGWISRYQGGTRLLSGATNNVITITGPAESNGGLVLLDADSRITPLNLNDVISVDFACTFVTPSGANNYVTVSIFVPTAGDYRTITIPFLKATGIDEAFSVSFALPVNSTFLANGADIIITPNVDVDAKEFYINAIRLHKGL